MDQLARFEASHSEVGRYRLLVEAVTHYAIYMLDPTGVVTSWNPGARRIKGYEAAEIIGHHFSRFYTEEDRRRGLPQRVLATAASDGKFEGEGWRVRKDGARFWAHVVVDPIRDQAGALIGFAKITRDLTERRAAEEAMRRSEEQFRLLVQSVTDYAIYMLDPTGRIISWNAGAHRIKGYSAEEIIGEHFSRFYREEDRLAGDPQRALATAAREGRFEKEGWRVRKDGTKFWAHVVVDPIRDERGEVIAFAKITRDMTDKKQAQAALERAREALFQAQKMEALGQLTGGIAHDFNNLLMAVLGSLELVKKRMPHDPRTSPLVENAIKGAERGAALTQRMLAFARRQSLAPQAVDVPALVRGMADLLLRTLGPRIEIESHFPAMLAPALTDAHQLELALLNLAVNARDAMPEGGTITISGREVAVTSSERGLAAGRYVCITVADEGEGMDAATLARAAEPFFTTKGVGKGTGLGLSMVHGLAEQSGGRLVLASRKGEGTTAELWLPVASADAPHGRAAPDEAPAAGNKRLVVLAVDDDALVLTNTAAMLEDLGHEVRRAASAEQALRHLEADAAIGLVVTDHLMPHMNGAELAARIRRERPDLPVVLATGFADLSRDVHAGLPRLAKPYRQEDLARVIADATQPDRADGSKADSPALPVPQRKEGSMAGLEAIREHMEVIGADGVHVGTVDHVEGDRIKLTKPDSGMGRHRGHHHYVSAGLVADVEGDKVRLSANGDVAVQFEEEQGGRAL